MNLLTDVVSSISKTVNVIFDREIRLGITGLSRDGKTALITSLINTICNFGDESLKNRMGRFPEYEKSGIYYGGLAKASDLSISRFPYQQAYESLTSEPSQWPVATDGISEVKLEIRFKDNSMFSLSENKSIFIDIWDYPGEWLMDLMLLNMDYEEFSTKIKNRLLNINNVVDSSPWVKAGALLNPEAKVNDRDLLLVVNLYKKWLKECKEYGFAMIVPGRFVLPGNLEGAPILEFIPWIWDSPKTESNLSRDSLYNVLKERYEAYKKQVIEKFYYDCFAKIDRQIVVVDCLKALRGGKETFFDINDSFDALMSNFAYGPGNFLTRLFSPKIDKVIFAATKADCITYDQHKNLLSLLQSMVKQAERRVRADGSSCAYMIISAIKATVCRTAEHNGNEVQVLTTDYQDDKPYFPGSVPPQWTRESMEFFQKYFTPKNLRPPMLNYGDSIPELNMDVLLHYILGDKL